MVVPFGYPIAPFSSRPRIAVICHLFYPDMATWLLQVLQQAELVADIFISTDTADKRKTISEEMSLWHHGEVTVRIADNQGRDVAPKILTFADVYKRYDLVLFLHSKKSPHWEFGERWRDFLVQSVAGSPSVVDSVLEIFRHNPRVGMVIPPHYPPLLRAFGIDWGGNFYKARRLAKQMGIKISAENMMDMPSGSIFWTRSEALQPILDLKLNIDDFSIEQGQTDGTLAHCIERLFLFSCEKAGFCWVKVINKFQVTPKDVVEVIRQSADIDEFIRHHRFDLIGQK